MSEFRTISFGQEGGRYTIALDTPPLNIIDMAMMREITRALDLVREDARLVVIRASGDRAFSAGVSIPEHEASQVGEMLSLFHSMLRRLHRIEVPTVALVQAMALGGGCELAMTCDFVVASEAARFGQPEIRLGLFPPVAVWHLQRQLPPRRGLEMLLTGEDLGPFEARDLGLINAVLDASDYERRAGEWLARFDTLSRSALRLTKKAWRASESAGSFDEAIERTERIYLDELMATTDAEEGIRAFMDKRSPRWRE